MALAINHQPRSDKKFIFCLIVVPPQMKRSDSLLTFCDSSIVSLVYEELSLVSPSRFSE